MEDSEIVYSGPEFYRHIEMTQEFAEEEWTQFNFWVKQGYYVTKACFMINLNEKDEDFLFLPKNWIAI